MLLGEYSHSLDREYRLALPARLRDALGEALADGLCLLCGAEACIVACPRSRVQALVEEVVRDAALSRRAVRDFKRALGSRSVIAPLDSQGRIRIPDALREHACIDRNVTIVGAVDAIEIWDAERYGEREAGRNAAYDKVASHIFA